METAKHKYGWKFEELVVGITFPIIGLTALYFGIFTEYLYLVFALIIGLFFLGLGVGVTWSAALRKRNSTLFAEMNPATGEAYFWMRKSNKAIWSTRIDKARNHGNLNSIKKLSYEPIRTIPVNEVLVFETEDGKVYVPERLATQPTVKKFLIERITRIESRFPFSSPEARKAYETILNDGKPFESAVTEAA